jgi:hypothetical protein
MEGAKLNFINTVVDRALVLVAVLMAVIAGPSHGSVIFLSGDSNITDHLVGAQGQPIDTGNQQFFDNILQGGTTVVTLDHGPSGLPAATSVNDYYNSLSGVTSALVFGDVTDADLAGADLFVSAIPNNPYTATEISALANFLAGGGDIFFLGEVGAAGWPVGNGRINDALTALGSGLSIVPATNISGPSSGTQIAVDPFTTGVASFSYLVASEVTGGSALFSGPGSRTFIAYEQQIPQVPVAPIIWLLGIGSLGLFGNAWVRAVRTS